MSRVRQIQSYFERRAAHFDRLYETRGFAYLVNRVVRRGLFARRAIALEQCAQFPGCTVLDVGSGSGRNSLLFVREGGASKVVGIDFSGPMVALARQLTAGSGAASRCEFLQRNFMEWSASGRFDLVVALGVFDYLDEPVAFLAKMLESCRRTLVFSAPGYSPLRMPLRALRYALRNCRVRFYSRNSLEDICRSAGLREFEIRRIASSGFVVIGRSTQ